MIRLIARFADTPVPSVLLKGLEDLQAACVGVNASPHAPEAHLIAFIPGPGAAFDDRATPSVVTRTEDGAATVEVTIRGREVPETDVALQDPGRAEPTADLSPHEQRLRQIFDARAEAAVMALRSHFADRNDPKAALAVTGLLTFAAKGAV